MPRASRAPLRQGLEYKDEQIVCNIALIGAKGAGCKTLVRMYNCNDHSEHGNFKEC